MKKIFIILLLGFSTASYAVNIDLLKQSLVGTWHPCMEYDNDSPMDENQLVFYLDGDNLMLKYVADYSWSWDRKEDKTFNEYGTCTVKVNFDGTIEFYLQRTETGYDRKGNEERKGWGEYSYKLFFVDGQLVGSETWGRRYLYSQTMNDRGQVRFKTIEQAKRRGNAHAFPFGNDPYETQVSFYNSDKTNIKKFYNGGVVDENSNCNPGDYKYGFLLGNWDYSDDGLWGWGNPSFSIKVFVRDGNYYVKYWHNSRSTAGVVQIFPNEYCGGFSFSFATKQEFRGRCEGYEWPWKYDFEFYVRRINDVRLSGTRNWTNVSGPIKACDVPEPQRCNINYIKVK